MLQRSIAISLGTTSLVGAGGLVGAYWTGGFGQPLSVRGELRVKANYPRKPEHITETGFTQDDYTRTEVFWRSRANSLTMNTNKQREDWLEVLRKDLGGQWKEYLETNLKDNKWYFKNYGNAARAILEWCEYYAEKDKDNELRNEMDSDLCNYKDKQN